MRNPFQHELSAVPCGAYEQDCRQTDQATGAKFIVPTPLKVGQLRSGGKIREGAVYYIFFANPGCHIKSGNKVTVVVGDFQARDVVVQ